jgi:hypothetical protein
MVQDLGSLHVILISALFALTWIPSIKGGWVSDDWEGIWKFSDRWDAKARKKIDTYEHPVGKEKKPFKNTAFNPHITFPGSVIRWLRLNLGKRYQVIGKDAKNHEVYGYVQSPLRHHAISLIVHYVTVLLLYSAFSQILGPTTTFFALLLFIVHPVSAQTVAWCSGIGYLLCLFGMAAGLNVALLTSGTTQFLAVLPFMFLSAYGLFSGAFNWVIFAFLGLWPACIASFLVFCINGVIQGKQIVGHRTGEFKKQNMAKSTVINFRKPIVMAKTLWYYVRLVFFPKRLGLFHKWGYHYDAKIERFDGLFLAGIIALAVMGWGFFNGPLPVQLGILWFLTYLIVFSNFITAMQFVVDRYAFIPSLGICLILTSLLPAELYWVVLGIFLMRTWTHLPTFKSETDFYLSNVFNFPDSEVAYGNLGVTYMNSGRPGSAIDTWLQSIKINDQYDVPHFNLYSIYKSQGMLELAKKYLDSCLSSKVVHFPQDWEKEREILLRKIDARKPILDQLRKADKKYGGKI